MNETATAKLWVLDVERVVHAIGEAGLEEQKLALDRLGKRYGNEARAEAEAKLAPKPMVPPPEPKPEPKARPIDTSPVLNPGAPYDNASEFIHSTAMLDGRGTLWFWQDQFYRWSGRVYEAVPHEVMRQQVYRFLDGSRKRSGEQLIRFQPTPRHVNETIDALKSQLALGLECQPPIWLEARKSAKDWVVFQNGIGEHVDRRSSAADARPLGPQCARV